MIMPRDDKHVWDGSDWFGASVASLQRLGNEKGYELVGCNLSGVVVREESGYPCGTGGS